MSDAVQLARLFSVLSVETRVRITELLRDRPLCVNALAGRLGITPAAVSQHLRIMRDVGLVQAEKRGYFVHYQVNHDTLARWRGLSLELFDGDREEAPAAQEGANLDAAAAPPLSASES